jgi:hypothetical protein
VVRIRQRASESSDQESDVQENQSVPSVKSVHNERPEQPYTTSAKRVSRYQQSKFLRCDIPEALQLRPKRHHDHEIHDVCELDKREKIGESFGQSG